MSPGQTGVGPHIDNPTHLPLAPEEKNILKIMFAAYQRATIKEEFVGGLSGGRVFLVRPIASELSPELPAVVKIAPSGLIEKEWRAFQEHVRLKLPGIAEVTDEPVLPPDNPWGGLRYTLMGEGGAFEIESLREYYGHASIADIRYVLEERLLKIAGPQWWQFSAAQADWPLQASYDFLLPVNFLIEPAPAPPGTTPHPLQPGVFASRSLSQGSYVRLEGFIVTEIDPEQKTVTLNVPPRPDGLPASYRLRLQPVEAIDVYQVNAEIAPIEGCVRETRYDQLQGVARDALGHHFDLTAATLTSPYGTTLPNPLAALPDLLGQTRNVRVSRIHGDLNVENILVEPAGRNVSLIDFATARRDHALHDLLRLETEVLTRLLPAALGETKLLVETIDVFYKRLHQATFAPTGSPSAPARGQGSLEKAFETLVTIRKMARQCLFDPHDWREYYEGLALYLLGALKFKNLDRLPTAPLPKQVALWAAAVACNFIEPVSVKGVLGSKDWSRLQKYLPAEMYQERDETTCLEHLNALLRAVLTYLPRHLALDLLREPLVAQNTGRFLDGTLILADISGFTAMSEKLCEKGEQEGAEEMVRVINEYLDGMLAILYKHNGRLIKFGGDAMLCLFAGGDQGAMNAVRAAWEMKRTMAERFAEFEVLQEIFPLEMKVGGNSGLLFAANVGTAEHMEYLLTGSAVERAARAESAARKGDVLITPETYELIRDDLEVEKLARKLDFYRVTGVRSEPLAETEDPWSVVAEFLALIGNDLWAVVDRLDAMSPYLSAGVLPQLMYNPQGGQIEGQHRQVTVLFANFVGIGDLIHARGFEDEAGIAADLSEYLEAMREEIQYYGGVINKVDLYDQGDKLMVLFGAPQAHEKDVQRAALAALAMQKAMGRLSPVASALLSQRIGLHSDFVFAGNVGSFACNRREYTVMGDTVNRAARLMSAAPPGEIWISRGVWGQIQAEFEAQDLPPLTVKGLSDPIAAYQLRATRGVQEGRLARALESDMVGREAELEALEACFDDLVSGGWKQVVTITGEAGVGKTRLVMEWKGRVGEWRTAESAVTWLNGRGHSYGQRTHGVFIEILEGLLAFADADEGQERWGKLSAWVRKTFVSAGPGWRDEFLNRLACLGKFLALDLSAQKGLAERVAGMEAEALQIQTRLALCDLLTHAAGERPLVLVLEDLHWADEASLDMLSFIVDRVGDGAPILFCLIFRPRQEHPIWVTWQEIARSRPDCHSIALRELAEADGRQLLSNLLERVELPEDFQTLVLDATDGNPLYVEEILHALIAEGTIARDAEGWQITRDVGRVRVPDTLYQIIQSRIDELDFGSPGARRVLWMASVIGAEFTHDLLRDLFIGTGRAREEFKRHLRELRNADMIQRVRVKKDGGPPGGEARRLYRFRHGLVQQVAYENMLVAKRRAYHSEVGRWLEEKHADDLPRYYDALAHHYDQGREWEPAFQYHWLTGQRDAAAFANQDAVAHLQRALEIASYADPGTFTLGQAHFELGKVLVVTGAFDAALEHLTQAWDLFGDTPGEAAVLHRARAGYEIGRTFVRIGGGENLETALEWQKKGRELLPETPTAEAALLHLLGAAVGIRQRDIDRIGRECERALELAGATGAKAELGFAHRLLAFVARAQGRLEQAMAHNQSSIEVCQELSDVLGLAKDYMNRGVLALGQGDWPLARESYLQALAAQERIGDKFQLAMTCSNLGDLCCHQGDLEQGLAYARRGLETFTALGAPQGIIFSQVVLATLYWRREDLEGARKGLSEVRELIEEHQAIEYQPTVGRWLAQVYLAAGELPAAEAEIQALLDLEPESLDVEAEPIQRLWGRILAARGELAEARQVLQDSLARLEQRGERYEMGCTLLALARVLAQMEGQAAEALAHAERAREIFADLGARLDLQEAEELIASTHGE